MIAQYNPWGVSQQYQPLSSVPPGSPLAGQLSGIQPLQQALPLLQIVPHQLQHLQQLVAAQLQQLQQLQQIVQLLPGQLQQLQQLIQFVPQQIQHFQQPSPFPQAPFQQPFPFQPPFGQVAAPGGFAVTSPWSVGAQGFGAQPAHVM